MPHVAWWSSKLAEEVTLLWQSSLGMCTLKGQRWLSLPGLQGCRREGFPRPTLWPHTPALIKAPLAVLDGALGAPGLKAPAPLQAHSGESRPSTERSCFALTYPPGWQCGAKVSFYLLVSVSVRETVNTFCPLLTEPFGSVGPSGLRWFLGLADPQMAFKGSVLYIGSFS